MPRFGLHVIVAIFPSDGSPFYFLLGYIKSIIRCASLQINFSSIYSHCFSFPHNVDRSSARRLATKEPLFISTLSEEHCKQRRPVSKI